jgi:hypothetical protein
MVATSIFVVYLHARFSSSERIRLLKVQVSRPGGPDNGLLIFSVTPADRTSKLLSFARQNNTEGGGLARNIVVNQFLDQ